MSDDAFDRDAILARRAILLAGALAAVHCTTPAPTTGTSGTATSTATTDGTAPPSGSGTPNAGGFKPLVMRPFTELLKPLPPSGVPDGLPDGPEKRSLVAHEAFVKAELEEYETIWTSFPDCAASDPDCRAKYRLLADRARPMLLRGGGLGGFGCGGYNAGDTGTLFVRRQRFNTFLLRLRTQIEDQFEALAKAQSPSGEQEWRKLWANAKVQPPMPCLSPCPMPELTAVTATVLFADGSATLDGEAQRAVENAAASFKGNRKPATLVVRGHRNPGETQSGLASARAKAVADALEKAGLAKKDLRVVALEDLLPVELATGSDAGLNRRVDFDLDPGAPKN